MKNFICWHDDVPMEEVRAVSNSAARLFFALKHGRQVCDCMARQVGM